MNTYKICVVRGCRNTTISAPNKLFIHVPQSTKSLEMRKTWLQLGGRNFADYSTKSSIYFCEDHFDLPRDMENYMQFKIMGSVKIKMKPNCVPSKFACLEGEAMENAGVTEETNLPSEESSSTAFIVSKIDKSIQTSLSTSTTSVQTESVSLENKCVQFNFIPKYRSRKTQTTTKKINQLTSPMQISTVSKGTSPFKVEKYKGKPSSFGNTNVRRKLVFISEEISDSEGTPSVPKDSTSLSVTSTEFRITDYSDQGSQSISTEGSTLQIIRRNIEKEFGQRSLRNTLERIQKNPKFYIGMPKDCFFLVNIILRNTNIPEEHIYLCLQKIRLNCTFTELGDHFGISKSYASKLFKKHVVEIAKVLQPFVRNSKKIKYNLPMAFRQKYYKIDYIIDCFEIEIQKPMKAVYQALSWSDYKKANTLKYLISSTPDGIINFISEGYSGRTSDVTVVEKCKFLENMEPGVSILADRGFKHLQNLCLQKGIELVRPPSVGSKSKLTKAEAHKTKEVASLRIHIERVIRRLREFSLLKPHSVINTNLLKVIDECVLVACALVNIQDSLIKSR
ncbi:uncharacterized protein LOC135116700 [Helicoverpa armigera]|uniref:uncharacterized protein LOC135116700 n=1 Tax=Helicoverpa armigera TaxID=29058 RepID=UPI0030832A7E